MEIADFTPEQEAELDALGEALTAAQASPWLARCLVEAFRPGALVGAGRLRLRPLTFESWLDLEDVRSPFLVDDWEGMRQVDRLAEALSILSGEAITPARLPDVLTPEEAVVAVRSVRGIIRAAFATALPMRRPGAKTAAATTSGNDGFGEWIALLTLMSEMLHQPPAALMGMRVAQAFALNATSLHLAGWAPRGANYAERELVLAGEEGVLLSGVPDPQADGERSAGDEQQEQPGHDGEAEQAAGPGAENDAGQPRNN